MVRSLISQCTDHCVGQVRIIFQPIQPNDSDRDAPYLVYAQRFDCAHAASGPNSDSGLFRLKRAMRGQLRLGVIVQASRIRCAVEVVPFYGTKVHERMTHKNSMEASTAFNLNTYSDKETFHLLRKGRSDG